MVMLDDTRGGLDASSLHRATSKYKSLAKKIHLLSCHRDNLCAARTKHKKSWEVIFPAFVLFAIKIFESFLCLYHKLTKLISCLVVTIDLFVLHFVLSIKIRPKSFQSIFRWILFYAKFEFKLFSKYIGWFIDFIIFKLSNFLS